MRKKDIKARVLILLRTAIKLFGLLCFFFSFTVSAQIFQSNDTKIFIGDETVVTQNFSQFQKTDSVHIYIKAGTTVTGLHSDQNIAVIYLEKPEETKTHLAKKHSEQKKKIAEHTPSEKKTSTTPKQTNTSSDKKTKLTISPSPASKNSIALLQTYKTAAIVTSNISFTKKLLDTITSCNHYFRDFEVNTKEVSNFLFQETKISFWLYSHTTRPPPVLSV